jgi:hypothetical protein
VGGKLIVGGVGEKRTPIGIERSQIFWKENYFCIKLSFSICGLEQTFFVLNVKQLT